MQLWDFVKCRAAAEENSAVSADGFVRIKKSRRALMTAAAICIILLAVLVTLSVMHSQKKEWDEVATHEIDRFELTAGECVEYSMDMTEGEYGKSLLVMPFRSIAINSADGNTDVYYVYLDNSSAEGIFHFDGELSADVQNWLDEWENDPASPPEPVEIIGKRGVMNISGSNTAAAEYDGKSYIEAGQLIIENEVPIEGAEEELARIEAEKKDFEERREGLFTGMCVVLGLLIAVIAAVIAIKHMYDRARRAFMAEMEAQD